MVESTFKENSHSVILKEIHLDPVTSYKTKPRALIFKSNEKDLEKIKAI